MSNKACIYALKHNPTGKIYVGCSCDVKRRVSEHLTLLKSGTHPVEMMQNDFDEFGDDYSYYVLFEAYASYDAFMMEKHFMSLLNTRNPLVGYNYKDNSNDFSINDFKEHRYCKTIEKANGEKICIKRMWLSEMRKARGLTQEQVSKRLGMSKQGYAYIENGRRRKLNQSLIEKLAIIYGASVQYIKDLENAGVT